MRSKSILVLAVVSLLALFCLASPSCAPRAGRSAADTLVVNTVELGAAVIGYKGPTPVEVTVIGGVITSVKALPNEETPRFFQRVLDSGLLESFVGKTPKQARALKPDAVSGATYSSRAVIENIRLALEQLK